MKRSIATLSFAAAALVATGALSENAVFEQRQQLAELWGENSTSQTANGRSSLTASKLQKNFAGTDDRRRETHLGPSADNWRGGMMFEPAGK